MFPASVSRLSARHGSSITAFKWFLNVSLENRARFLSVQHPMNWRRSVWAAPALKALAGYVSPAGRLSIGAA